MVDRTNTEWQADLHAGGERQALALEDLRGFIVSRISCAFGGRVAPGSPELEALLESAERETLSQVLEHPNAYDGLSTFTTWVLKIAVRQALWELRRQRSHGMDQERALPEISYEMYTKLEMDEFLQYLHRILKEELTENQRIAIRAMIMSRVPKEEVAQRLGMKRHDYFKMIHDARLRLKRRFEADGWPQIAGEK